MILSGPTVLYGSTVTAEFLSKPNMTLTQFNKSWGTRSQANVTTFTSVLSA